MSLLLVGFDSAWTPGNSGALVGAVLLDNRSWAEMGPPVRADFVQAEQKVIEWQEAHSPTSTLILLDQPTIVPNESGQRPVESIVASPVSLRYGGVQPANTRRADMFGPDAPVWGFLRSFGGPAPLEALASRVGVFETYPVLAMIALGWTLADERPAGRLPKYNPERRKTFSIDDWKHVCARAAAAINDAGLSDLSTWVESLGGNPQPRKCDQDALDACLCLVVALHAGLGRECLAIGDAGSGYMLVPHGANLEVELIERCKGTGRDPGHWIRRLRLFDHGLQSPLGEPPRNSPP